MSVALIAKLTAKAGQRQALVDALQPVVDAVADEPGTLGYVLNLDDKDENVVWFYELYSDRDALKSHSTSEAMTAAIPKLGEVLEGGMELHRMTPVAAKGLPV